MEISQDDRLENRRCAFVCAAWDLFSEQGFERTTLADVVDRAGGSLATLYKLFGNKTGLLQAVIEERARAGQDFMAETASRNLSPVETLMVIGAHFQSKMLQPADVAISRIVIAYSLQHPDFAQEFYQKTLARSHSRLTELFKRWQDEGIVMHEAPETLAAIFLGMFVYDLHTKAISHGNAPTSNPERLKERVSFFCRGAGITG